MKRETMKNVRRIVIGVFLTIIVIAISTCGVESDKAKAVQTVSSTAPIDLSGVNCTGLARLMYGRCGEWHDLAISVGWTEAQWKKLSFVIYRESRYNIKSFNKTDPNGGSRGLMQINGYWCKKNKYNPSGWLQAKKILNTCEDLYNPEVNLRAGLAMWHYSQERNKCGWRPWATRC